jgi:hypothetical protein
MDKETVKEIFKSPSLALLSDADVHDIANAIGVLGSFRAAFVGTPEEENFNRMLADMNMMRCAAQWRVDASPED